MKHTLMICFLLLFAISANSQTTKGLSVPKTAETTITGKTYALIVGVSKYKNPAIPQLKYADRDAMAFRNYLIATGVDSNNIMLLLNEKATNGEFWASIGFLQDVAKKGDKVYIYFSGHGDVENKTVVKDAYLLPYDAPKCMYPAGAIAVILLKNYIGTLSASGIQAIFIADACRSGNLAGGREGMEAAAAMLKENWQDEIKILSCQPGELSLEGPQWGGGRGLFSYELINGMAGMADKNKDGKVTLRELTLYMMEKVPEAASPAPQNPAIYGNPEAAIGMVTPAVQKEIITGGQNMLAYADTKGFEESLLAGLDDSIKYNYRMYKAALDTDNYFDVNKKMLLEQKEVVIDPSAYYYFIRIPDNDKTHLLVALMKRNLCSAIMEATDTSVDQFFRKTGPDHFRRLHFAMPVLRNMLGDKKLNDYGFLPKLYFVDVIQPYSLGKNMPTIQSRIAKMDTAISIAPSAGYLYALRGALFIWGKNEKEGIADYKKAIQLSPKSPLAYFTFAEYYDSKQMFDSTISLLRSLLSADSSYKYECWLKISTTYSKMNKRDSAHYYVDLSIHALDFDKVFHQESKLYDISCAYSLMNDQPKAIVYLEKSIINGYKNYARMQVDTDLANIHSNPEYKALMKKYFPNDYKE